VYAKIHQYYFEFVAYEIDCITKKLIILEMFEFAYRLEGKGLTWRLAEPIYGFKR